jgi:Flp pilus assembly protein TadB
MSKISLKKRIESKSKVFVNCLDNGISTSKGAFYTVMTAVAVAQINFYLVNSVTVLLLLMSVIVHEYGHYIFGKSSGGKATHPLFLPVPYLIIGLTNIKNIDREHQPVVALSGMFAGLSFLVLLSLFNVVFNFVNPLMIVVMILFEFLFNYFGFDGKKYRNSRREK